MSVRAKFTVQKVEIGQQYAKIRTANGDDYEKDEKGNVKTRMTEIRTVVLSPVYGNNDPKHENTQYWDYSPSGEIRLGTINRGAWEQFEIGKEYYVDFTPAE